jgi:hypothetical protein
MHTSVMETHFRSKIVLLMQISDILDKHRSKLRIFADFREKY